MLLNLWLSLSISTTASLKKSKFCFHVTAVSNMYSLMPKEPIKRANIRFAIEHFGSKITPEMYKYAINSKEDAGALDKFKENVNTGLKRVRFFHRE